MGAEDTSVRRLRLWPGILSVLLLWGFIYVPGWFWPGTEIQMYAWMFGTMAAQLMFLVWWIFFSRASWLDRIIVLVIAGVAGIVARQFAHPTNRDMMLFFAPSWVLTVWVVWLLVTSGMRWPARRAGLLAGIALTWAFFTLVRFEGTDGYFTPNMAFRWTVSSEEKFLAHADEQKLLVLESAPPLELGPGDWPGFRGANRDGRLTGVTIATNWESNPPKEIWRRPVGPGWSSFTVIGKHAFTQEQHDQNEAVVCYDVTTGKKIWEHHDKERFSEVIAGAGPRATPTFHDGKLYCMGANGRLNCLDAATGKAIWSKAIVTDTTVDVPIWGFASSPLVSAGLVTVYAGGGADQEKSNVVGMLAFDANTGNQVWKAGEARSTYGSVHLARLTGVEQLLMTAHNGMTAYDPATGKVLWTHDAPVGVELNRVVQPTVLNDSEVLLGTGFGKGTRRIRVTRDNDKWNTEEVWTTRAISPYFNDVVVHNDHLYGFDGGKFTCVSLADRGKSKWRVRGYDNGQVLLLADQGILVVQCEKGDVALVAANPEKHEELGRIPALKAKTWNHPVIAHGRLLVRNGEEAVCYQLSLDASSNGKSEAK